MTSDQRDDVAGAMYRQHVAKTTQRRHVFESDLKDAQALAAEVERLTTLLSRLAICPHCGCTGTRSANDTAPIQTKTETIIEVMCAGCLKRSTARLPRHDTTPTSREEAE